MTYLNDSNGYKNFRSKNESQKQLINEALAVIEALGIPVDAKPRKLEKMAMAFLTLADVSELNCWGSAKSVASRSLTTREIISWVNEKFDETISSGSYDDIRRQDLKLLALADVAVQRDPNSSRNSPKRAWGLSKEAALVARSFGTDGFISASKAFLAGAETLRDTLASIRELEMHSVSFGGGTLSFGPGEHNGLIKAIIEDFLPRYGFGAEVLYVGDASVRQLHVDEEALQSLNFFDLAHGEMLPDVVAFSSSKGWLYLIEAVHSSGTVSPERLLELERLLAECLVPVVYVTAFQSREKFRQFVSEIAWESEVWIASDPDHLIHFNGDKFLGPYSG